ncbi:WD40-repeat containing [Chondrus crispus]|uniref:WD40-repeat containing n=1 Tax=Chondrus crispus TaxID=2769 RepID=R7QGG1_CHOCR|nr:WD40-repeat containing [Chondrus crispus]CDF36531.1 WD40-repeat containing [Chondrus crispus]|eukprot:XP_005716350.1 WD40-repeat containing [Chondrus crispus]
MAKDILDQYLKLKDLTGEVAKIPIHDLEPIHKNELQKQIQAVSRSVSELVNELKDETKKPKGRFRALVSAIGDRTVLLERQEEAEKLYASLDKVRTELHGVRETRRQGSRVVGEIRSHAPVADVFKPSFGGEFNSPTVLVDLDSAGGGVVPNTVEGRLKAAVLSNGTTSHVGATAVGQAGVGKTCALRAIAHDREVVARFPDGVYFSTLGQDAREAELKQRLCNAVRISGGHEKGDKLSNLADLEEVLTGVKSWFADRRCLFIFDDVWSRNNNDERILLKLSTLASTAVRSGEPASRVLYSTRDPDLTDLGEQVKFEPRKGRNAYDMLIHASGASRGEVEDPISREAIGEILDMCAGLPLALNVAGVTVKRSRDAQIEDRPDLWTWYLETIKESKGSGGIGAQEARGGYESLHAMLRSSLQFLDSRGSEGFPRFADMHRALCVMKKQDVIPVAVLKHLWGTRDVNIAKKYATQMNSVGLVDIRVLSNTKSQVVSLHDLTHDFAVFEADQVEDFNWDKHCCRKLVDNYRKEKDVVEIVVEDQGPEASTAEEGYFFENICRLLFRAELMEELSCLLRSSRWTIKVLLRKAVWQLVEAVGELREVVSQKPELIGSEQLSAIILVMQAARLTASSCDESVAGICFQLYSRTMHKRHVKSVESFLLEIERFAPRPWLFPIRPCLTAAGGNLLETFDTPDSKVQKVTFDTSGAVVGLAYEEWGERELEIFTGTKHGSFDKTICGPFGSEDVTSRVTAACISKDSSRAVIGFSNGELITWCTRKNELVPSFEGHSAGISAVVISSDGKRVASGSGDKTVRVWDAETGVQIGETMTGHTDSVRSVSMSGDGKRVASGSADETVRVWDAETGGQIGKTMTGHTDSVRSVSLSGDGKRVASGSADETVRVWDAETGVQIGETMTGHTNSVWSVSMSGDGKRVASGSGDKTVRVWDAETGVQIGETMTGHTYSVWSVSLSGDGKRVASGSADETVRVWDAETGVQIGETMTGHTDSVSSVSMSGDGKRVASGSRDKTVRVWDAETGVQIGETMTGHTNSVWSVSMSGDGKRVASGSRDKTVRVWDAETGVQIGETMTGHTDSVRSVSLSGDGKRVASGSDDWTVRVLNAETGSRIGDTIAHECEGGVWPLNTFGIDKGRAFVEQGDGTKITLAELGSGLETIALSFERGTVAVGMKSGMVGIMAVVSSNHPMP